MNFLSSIITSHIFSSRQKILISRNPKLQTAKKKSHLFPHFLRAPGERKNLRLQTLYKFSPREHFGIFLRALFFGGRCSPPPLFSYCCSYGEATQARIRPSQKSGKEEEKRRWKEIFLSLFCPFPPVLERRKEGKAFFPVSLFLFLIRDSLDWREVYRDYWEVPPTVFFPFCVVFESYFAVFVGLIANFPPFF